MKRFFLREMLLILAFLLTSCAYHNPPGPCVDLNCENWQRRVDIHPKKWALGADSWFFNGGMNIKDTNRDDLSAVASTMTVSIPNEITNIRVNGCFQVQLYGVAGHNSLYLFGSNEGVRGVEVQLRGNTLCLSQAKNAPSNIGSVIVRIGIRNLKQLNQMGPGTIEGRLVASTCLSIFSSGCGNIYLGGRMNLAQVVSTCGGNVNVFGAITPQLDIYTSGAGSVNVSGNVGIHCITHHGGGNVNIIGANSDGLCIYADGVGKIGIEGRVNLREIKAKDHTCVYVYYVNGDLLSVSTTDYAHVGVAGCIRSLYVDAGKSSRFGGRYLYADDGYVKARDAAHVNVMGASKIFAASTQNSSVYYYGSPSTLSQFIRQNGVIISIPMREKYPCGYCPYFARIVPPVLHRRHIKHCIKRTAQFTA